MMGTVEREDPAMPPGDKWLGLLVVILVIVGLVLLPWIT